jgi:hypothetical protein
MKSSPIIVLFGTPPPPLRRGPSGIVISLVVHAFAFALLFAGLNAPHRVDSRSELQRYAVRIMELHRPEPKEQKLARSGGADPGHAAAASHESGGGQESAAAARIPLNFLSQQKAVQTLIQPDVQRNVVIPQEAALPQVLQWSPPDPAISKIVLPTPQIVVQIKVQPTLHLARKLHYLPRARLRQWMYRLQCKDRGCLRQHQKAPAPQHRRA